MQFKTWLERTNGKRIIVTDRISNGNRLLRRCNLKENMDICQTNCMTIAQIAQELLYAWTAFEEPGKTITVLDQESCVYLLDELVRTGGYKFVAEECFCVKTTEAILRSLNQIRMNKATEAFKESREEKILELKDLKKRYESRLQERDCYDEALLLRKGLLVLEQIKHKNELYLYLPWLDQIHIGYLEDLELTALENDFWSCMLTLAEVPAQKLEFYTGGNDIPDYRFFSAYGMVNEVRYVIEDIWEKGYPFDQVNVFYTSKAYEPFIRSGFESRGILCHFATGENVSASSLIQLLLGLLEFAKGDYLYALLNPVMENPLLTFERVTVNANAVRDPLTCFNHFIRKGIGWGRERYLDCIRREEEREESKAKYEGYLQFLKDLMKVFREDIPCGELYRSLLDFASKYTTSNIERNRILSALRDGTTMFDLVTGEKDQKDYLLLIEEYLKSMTMKGSENEFASVQVMKIQNLEVLERPYQYVIGLSAKQFQADTTESPVLSDEELERYLIGTLRFAKDNGRRLAANLGHSFETLSNGEIVLGYSTFDTVELKESSPSVFYLDHEEKFSKGVKAHASYPVMKEAIIIPVQENDAEEKVKEETTEQKGEKKSLSPSALQTLIGCPLHYYYQYEMRIPNREFQEKRAYQWLNPANRGNLFHRTMEEYGKEILLEKEISDATLDLAVFTRIYQESLKQMLEEQAYSSEVVYQREVEENEQMIRKYLQDLLDELYADYLAGKKWRILGLEFPFEQVLFTVEPPEGESEELQVAFKGSIDRLDAYVDTEGTLWLRVVDYKTGKADKKKAEIKADEQIQHVVYALAAERYAREQQAELEKLFGTTIKNIAIESAKYVFPHLEGEERVLDVDNVKKTTDCGGEVFEMPETVQAIMWNVFVKGNYNKANPKCDYCTYQRQCRKKLGTEM